MNNGKLQFDISKTTNLKLEKHIYKMPPNILIELENFIPSDHDFLILESKKTLNSYHEK